MFWFKGINLHSVIYKDLPTIEFSCVNENLTTFNLFTYTLYNVIFEYS